MPTHERSLIGSVLERTKSHVPPAPPSSRFTETPETGFPAAKHRLKSVFARAREEGNSKGDTTCPKHPDSPFLASRKPPPVVPARLIVDTKPIPTDTDALLLQIQEENTHKISQMSDDEIEQERRAILEQLGEGTEQLLRRVQEMRLRKEAKEKRYQTQADLDEQTPQEALRKNKEHDDTSQTTEENGDRRHVASVTSPPLHHVSGRLSTQQGILRVKSLDDIGRSVPSPVPETSQTRPSSRTGRKLRFAEVTPSDVHVYESAPVSPKRTVLALPPPPDTRDDSVVSLGAFHGQAVPTKQSHSTDRSFEDSRVLKSEAGLEEGTPEHIRRRYFPNVSANDPGVAWMEVPSVDAIDASVPRFDLHGSPIPVSLSASLPSHLGLHHHAEGSHAGYTIDDIFLLARSTVPAQRALMLGTLAKIAHRLGRQVRRLEGSNETLVFVSQEGELRKRILTAGLSTIDQIGSLGAQAVEVAWECLVEWDRATIKPAGVEFATAPDIVSSLQLDNLLPHITNVLSHAALPHKSLTQLLDILHWLAQQSCKLADMIVATPRLVLVILNLFILTPIPPREEHALPNPLALQLLITLASASRSNALALLDLADALLRFLTLLPPSSPYPPTLSDMLLTHTLKFYTVLASYGLYSQIATGASHIFTTLTSYIKNTIMSDVASRQLRIDWVSLIETWTVCATDSHATDPPHEIFWSQICAWGWAADVRKLRKGLGGQSLDWPVHAAIWECEAAWLEGSRINGIKAGEEEREEALQGFEKTFLINDGLGFGIVRRAIEVVQHSLSETGPTTLQAGALDSIASAGNVLASALRLWLACLPPLGDSVQLSAPPFALPLSELSALSAMLVKHPIWSLSSTLDPAHLRVHLRPLTRFLIYFHRVSQHIPGTTPQLWFAQAVMFLSCLLPGDESFAFGILDAFSLVTPQFIGVDPSALPRSIQMDVLRPFFEYSIRPDTEMYVAALRPTTESISRSSTLRLPASTPAPVHIPSSSDSDDTLPRRFTAGLPVSRDFIFTPLTHLLRSGTSPIFRDLPNNWTASEVDVVRSTLLLTFAVRKVLIAHGLEAFVHSAAEVVFACMRVCMLEHGVGLGMGAVGAGTEVFRDAEVEKLMTWLLEPFTVRGGALETTPQVAVGTLEDASQPYLGATPFYQFYTDLVALYGAVSFVHRTFAMLVVVPLAMHYPVDYRRALWCGGDGAHSGTSLGLAGAGLGDVVRTVRLPIEDLICTAGDGVDPREYLYPIEQDAGVLGAYMVALVSRDGGKVDGFLRLVAVHHVACTLWGESNEKTVAGAETGVEGETKRREEMRARLLKLVLLRGEPDVIQDVVLYRQRQRQQGPFVWPPACYRGEGPEDATGWREERLALARRVMGEGTVARVEALLTPTI